MNDTKMKRHLLVVLVAVIAFAAGTLVGIRTDQYLTFAYLEAEVARTLGLHVEILSLFRTQNEQEAIAELEASVNRAVFTLHQERAVSDLPELTIKALGTAKLYRTSFSPEIDGAQEAWLVLEQVPAPAVLSCSPALQDVARRARH